MYVGMVEPRSLTMLLKSFRENYIDSFIKITRYENISNINKTSFAFTFITFITQKLNKNKIRLFHSLLVIFFFHINDQTD